MKMDLLQIKDTEIDNLDISYTAEDGMVMLFTPNMNDTSLHYHIELKPHEYIALYSFLSRYVPEPANEQSLTNLSKR